MLWKVAWRNLWRHKRRSLIAAVAMAVAVALCMATIAFQDGMFDKMFDVMVEQQLGHVQVHHPDYPAGKQLFDTLHDVEGKLKVLDQVPGTVAVSAKLEGFALVGGPVKSQGAMLVGVDPARDRQISPLSERLVQGRYLADQPDHEILLGVGFAKEIEVGVGEEVVAVTQSADGSMGNELYQVVGIVKTGNGRIDRGGGVLHLADLQSLLVLPHQAHTLTLLSDRAYDLDPYVARVREAVGAEGVEVQVWSEAAPEVAQMFAMKDVGNFMILGIVFTAAAFGVLNTMMMSVFERTRELGVLKAIGLRPSRMVALIVYESAFLAALACVIGLALGGAADAYLVIYGFDMSAAAPDGFEFAGVVLDPVLKGSVRVGGVALVLSATFVVSLLASLYPAFRASRLRPVQAIRSESS